MTEISAMEKRYNQRNPCNVNLQEYVTKLRRMLKEEGNLHCPEDHDELLIRFIRARKFNLERARKSIKHYFNMKNRYSELVQNLHPRSLQSFYEKKVCTVLGKRDEKGRQLLLIRMNKWDPNEIDLLRWLIYAYAIVEGMIAYLETQMYGISLIIDFKGLNFQQVRQVHPRVVQIIFEILQDTLPVSFQEFHLINHSLLFNMIWTMARPFIKEKLRKRINFHGHDEKSLHRFISPEILPMFLGGQLTNEEAEDKFFLGDFMNKDDYYKEFLQYGCRKSSTSTSLLSEM